MADVRLTATNPEDSSVVPVACNAKGELLLEEPIDNSFDGNLDGDLIVSGKVGIGTTNPIHKLSVDTNNRLWNVNDDGAYNYATTSATNTSGGAVFHRQVASRFHFGTEVNGSNDLMMIGNDGKVGIGTTDPRGPLEVETGASNNRSIVIDKSDLVQGAGGPDLTNRIYSRSNSGGAYFELKAYAIDFSVEGADSAIYIRNGNGNVGIGKKEPQANLDVNGEAIFSGDVVVGSRNKKWMLVEMNGLCHMVEQTNVSTADLDDPDSSVDSSVKSNFVDSTALEYPHLRDVFGELDVIEKALEDVMEKLRMTVPNGWPVWDGSDNEQEKPLY